jgi:alpha-acetolactate decarboxylase
MNYLLNIINKIRLSSKSQEQQLGQTNSQSFPRHKHLWQISISCPDKNMGCQAAHFKTLSSQEATEYSKTQPVFCFHCHIRYN